MKYEAHLKMNISDGLFEIKNESFKGLIEDIKSHRAYLSEIRFRERYLTDEEKAYCQQVKTEWEVK